MKNKIELKSLTLFVVGVIVFIISCSSPNEITDITNLSDSQWDQIGTGNWSISDDVITGDATGGEAYLMSKKAYTNFLLTLEFKPDSLVNSGIYVRCSIKEGSAEECHEINIWDNHPNQNNRTGAIVNRVTPTSILNTIDKWNAYRIQCEGDSITVELNGVPISSHGTAPNRKGFIGLQAANNGKIQFRSLKILELD